MRIGAYSLIVVGLLAASASAQQPADLDTVLRGWEKTMTDLRSFACIIERVGEDKVFDTKDQHAGYAYFLKARDKKDVNRAFLKLTKNPQVFEQYICVGTDLYEYVPANKLVRLHKIPDLQGGLPQENLLSFLFGVGAQQAKARYTMTVDKSEPANPDFYIIHIEPKTAQDKGDFTKARLLLYRSNHMPAQIWYEQPNKNTVAWNFTKVQVNAPLELKHFNVELPDDGWRIVPAKALPLPQKKGG
jgi:TIGR03009 family protein